MIIKYKFNLICIGLIVFFSIGILWQWRFVFVERPTDLTAHIQVISRDEILGLNEETILVSETSTDPVGSTEEEIDEESAGVEVHAGLQNISVMAEFNLGVPFTSQAPERNWEQPWQDACEEAAILMLDAYYKGYGLSPLFAKEEILKLISWEKDLGWGGSINIEKIKQITEEYFGFEGRVKIISDPTVEQIKDYIRSGSPVLVVADGRILPNPYYTDGGPVYHAFVIRGFTETEFITNDPGINTGTNFIFPIGDVMNSVRDWNNGDVENGRRAILVIE